MTAMASVGLVAGLMPKAARAADQIQVFDYAGYELPELYPPYFDKHGSPNYAFYASEQEMATKMQAGYRPDVVHPCVESWGRIADAGLLKPIDPSRLSNWSNVFSALRDNPAVRDGDGNLMMLPTDWGNTSIIYRTDLYEGEESWCMLFDERIPEGWRRPRVKTR